MRKKETEQGTSKICYLFVYIKTRHGDCIRNSAAMPYLTPRAIPALKGYKYSGSDNSFIFVYLLTPMNNFLIQFFPLWMAPNLITLISFMCGVMGYLVTAYHLPLLGGLTEKLNVQREGTVVDYFLNFVWKILEIIIASIYQVVQFSPATSAALNAQEWSKWLLYEGELGLGLPIWVYYFAALMLFLYQTLDNLDGKQARRTGTSSPLGLLFDHGCDAANITMSTLTVCTCIGAGNGWELGHLWLLAFGPFVMTTLEEYYTGSLYLGVVNGPTDGILISIILILMNPIFGPGFMTVPLNSIIPSVYLTYLPAWLVAQRGLDLFLLAGYILVPLTLLSNVVFAYAHILRSQKTSVLDPPFRLIPFALIAFSSWYWRVLCPDVFALNPRIFLFTHGLLFANLVFCCFFSKFTQICKLMLAHTCHQAFFPFRFSLIPLFLGLVHAYFGAPFMSNTNALYLVFAANATLWLHFCVNVIDEICVALNIKAFTIPYKQEKAN